jgi:hypothetical protein
MDKIDPTEIWTFLLDRLRRENWTFRIYRIVNNTEGKYIHLAKSSLTIWTFAFFRLDIQKNYKKFDKVNNSN